MRERKRAEVSWGGEGGLEERSFEPHWYIRLEGRRAAGKGKW